ncbi:MAG: 7-cyano-7-deazaguanine synthase QueC [Lentisphaeria bacterium]|nr:7-cyano-7-deazaguanine synthase QueC [Lentisphaeria bacterium]
MTGKKAIILLSGGLDSATCLAIAKDMGFECYALSFSYGQRHTVELDRAAEIAKKAGVAAHSVIDINLALWGGSALTDPNIAVPDAGESDGIPVTYVPARNLIFLSFAAAYAEAIGSCDIFIGVNSIDYSGYPDCRKEFIDSFTQTANLATKAADEKWKFKIHAPLQSMSKKEIIRKGTSLGVDYSLTTSCYNPDELGRSCGKCDSCALRKAGFAEAGIPDPTIYS